MGMLYEYTEADQAVINPLKTESKAVPGYCGICAICFWPIKDGELMQIRENGINFHRKCLEEKPNSYYARLERRLRQRIGRDE